MHACNLRAGCACSGHLLPRRRHWGLAALALWATATYTATTAGSASAASAAHGAGARGARWVCCSARVAVVHGNGSLACADTQLCCVRAGASRRLAALQRLLLPLLPPLTARGRRRWRCQAPCGWDRCTTQVGSCSALPAAGRSDARACLMHAGWIMRARLQALWLQWPTWRPSGAGWAAQCQQTARMSSASPRTTSEGRQAGGGAGCVHARTVCARMRAYTGTLMCARTLMRAGRSRWRCCWASWRLKLTRACRPGTCASTRCRSFCPPRPAGTG